MTLIHLAEQTHLSEKIHLSEHFMIEAAHRCLDNQGPTVLVKNILLFCL